MIILFVLDTSGSMNQRMSNGMTLIDVAKAAIEHLFKIRNPVPKNPSPDRYLLVTCEEGLSGIKVNGNYLIC